MASGYKSVHPMTEALLRELGVPTEHVTQGYGNAAASAGFHTAEGVFGGRKYSSCVDLHWCDDYVNSEFFSRFVAAGFCPFYRAWEGNYHIHAVQVGLTDDHASVTILPGPRSQIVDFTRGLNGLVGHAKLTDQFAPNAKQRAGILKAYQAWQPDQRTVVNDPGGKQLPCWAFFDGNTVTVEVRKFVEGAGGSLIACAEDVPVQARLRDGTLVSANALVSLEGDFCRGQLRPLARMMGLKIASFERKDGGTWAEVRLG